MRSVESVVVWSSMSTVSVVPALTAAWAISLAWPSATAGPSGRCKPKAVNFTDTSALPPWLRPRADNSRRRVR
ncbi:MAG: hypothetical protein BWY91_02331 [bacterium ADurb.BinA028]|nr:MAG: hypothetical protein BWY91_02331 [bacterium ADurb.BinA028]